MAVQNSPPPAPFFSSLCSSLLSLNGLLVLSVVLCAYAATVTPTPPCQVIVTGEAVRIIGCAEPSHILANLNLAPWNGVKFPILQV
ncbi:Triple gene block protein 3 [Asparagus virus 3]|uniref:Movement protein TGBp3 n=1 Tax=Asparagus virus 3 TaxID=445435 RepID=B1B3P1_9VIRU|nr:Triple gene block protein 3 [Asparagus virus 3]BAG12161.1 Triple gene block protein 3 [Asparagus virus 3]